MSLFLGRINLNKIYLFGLVLLFFGTLVGARVPTVNGDNNAWGTVLNDHLAVSLNGTGNLNNLAISVAGQIHPGIINATHIGNNLNAILNATYVNGEAFSGAQIANLSIHAADLASSIVNATHIGAEQVTLAKMAVDSVNSTHIVDATVASADIAQATIVAGDIAIGAVNTTHLVNGLNVNASMVNVTANLTIGNGGNETVRLNAGTGTCGADEGDGTFIRTGTAWEVAPNFVFCASTTDYGVQNTTSCVAFGANTTGFNTTCRYSNGTVIPGVATFTWMAMLVGR